VTSTYTRAVRRWLCVVALLFSLTGQGYAFAARVVEPVAIERPLDARPGGRLVRTAAWWQAS
jgi:hypothetical protein